MEGKHIRVDCEGEGKKNDFETTVFVGNLPFRIEEEDVRSHFEQAGKVDSVRIIRDPLTLNGKGIGYVKFQTKEEMRKAIDELGG